jgi:hypothetical protein
LDGTPAEFTDQIHNDEFPLSMFYEALGKKLGATITATAGVTGLTSTA